jgi:L-iditol 2-dehydrogenase
MRGYKLVDRRQLVYREDLPKPTAQEDNVVVKVEACSVCGRSDLVYYHYLGLRDHCSQGVFGHEVSGVVEEVGSLVTRCQPGDRVFLRSPLQTGFAEYTLAREVCVGHLPESIPFEEGSILQLLPLAIHATRGVRIGDNVLIVGQGPVGLMALQVARLRGAASITVVDLDAWRLQFSQKLQADRPIVVTPETLLEQLKEFSGQFDVAIDAVGTPLVVNTCAEILRQQGLLVLLGSHHVDTHVVVDLVLWEKKGLRIHTSAEPTDQARRESMHIAQRLVDNNLIQLKPLLTHVYPLEELPTAIEKLSHSPLLYAEKEVPPVDKPPFQTLKVSIRP